jgi:hypothetical protein
MSRPRTPRASTSTASGRPATRTSVAPRCGRNWTWRASRGRWRQSVREARLREIDAIGRPSAEEQAGLIEANYKKAIADAQIEDIKRARELTGQRAGAMDRTREAALPFVQNPEAAVGSAQPIIEKIASGFGTLLGGQPTTMFDSFPEEVAQLREQFVDPIMSSSDIDPAAASRAARRILSMLPARGDNGRYGWQRGLFKTQGRLPEQTELMNEIIDDLEFVVLNGRRSAATGGVEPEPVQ